jgi:hypothetical protein
MEILMESDATRKILTVSVIVIILAVPLILKKIPPNGFIGFRTPKTLSTPEIWYAANRYLGWALLFAGLSALICDGALFCFPGTVNGQNINLVTNLIILGPLAAAFTGSFLYLRKL